MKRHSRIGRIADTVRDHIYSHVLIERKLQLLDDKLRLLLDNTLEIGRIPKARGKMRIKQEICLQILRILDGIAGRNGIPYWLDFGTLLGAVRHQGFIPWDDDLDISLLHADYDRFFRCLEKELPPHLSVAQWQDGKGNGMGIMRVVEDRSFFYVDLYPYESVPGAMNRDGRETAWAAEYHREYAEVARLAYCPGFTPRLKKRIEDWMRRHGSGDGDQAGIAISMLHAAAPLPYRMVYADKDIFPLGKASFEGHGFPVPREAERVLSLLYGDYSKFPPDAGHPLHLDGADRRLSQDWLKSIVDELAGTAGRFA